MINNFLVLDIETTGLDPTRCGILEIAAVTSSGSRFYRRVSINRGCYVEPDALAVNGIDPLDLGNGEDVLTVLSDFIDWLDGHDLINRWYIGGKNPNFDVEFLKSVWPSSWDIQYHDKFYRRTIDLHTLAAADQLVIRDTALPVGNIDLDEVYKSWGIDPEPKPHNALRGAIHTMQCFRVYFLPRSGFDGGAFNAWLNDELTRDNQLQTWAD